MEGGNTGVRTYAAEGGRFVQRYDGFENKRAYSTASDSAGPNFKSGLVVYRPLAAATTQTIVGHRRSCHSGINFRTDGTYHSGHPQATQRPLRQIRLERVK